LTWRLKKDNGIILTGAFDEKGCSEGAKKVMSNSDGSLRVKSISPNWYAYSQRPQYPNLSADKSIRSFLIAIS